MLLNVFYRCRETLRTKKENSTLSQLSTRHNNDDDDDDDGGDDCVRNEKQQKLMYIGSTFWVA